MLWASSFAQNLQNFDIILTSDERRVLISHLDLSDLSDVFLTKRQRLAVQEEEHLRSQGFEPFSQESDGLPITASRQQALALFSQNLRVNSAENIDPQISGKLKMSTFVDFGFNNNNLDNSDTNDTPVEDPNASFIFPVSKFSFD